MGRKVMKMMPACGVFPNAAAPSAPIHRDHVLASEVATSSWEEAKYSRPVLRRSFDWLPVAHVPSSSRVAAIRVNASIIVAASCISQC